MHVVTKILVVLAAVATLFLSALVISYSVNAQRIVDEFKAERDKRIAVEATNSAQIGKASEEQARLTRRVDSLSAELTNLRQQLVDLQTENGNLKRSLATAEAARDSFDNKVAQLGEGIKTLAELNRSYRDEVTGLRDKELGFRTREIDLVDRINDQDSQIDVLEQSVRALQEELTDARRRMEHAATTGTEEGGVVVSSVNVRGRVVETALDKATGKTLVRIDLGTEDQVRQNMKLYVSRGGQYLGSVKIVSADLQDSIAEVVTLNGDASIRADDEVRSRYQ